MARALCSCALTRASCGVQRAVGEGGARREAFMQATVLQMLIRADGHLT